LIKKENVKMKESGMTGKLYIIALVAIILVGIITVCPGMNNCVNIDEARSADIAAMSFTGIVSEVAKDNHPPLYYLILALWMRMFGNSELALRALSILFYIAGAVGIYCLVNYIYKSKTTGLFTSALFAFSSVALRHSINVRMYSMLSPVIVLSCFFFIKIFLNGENTFKNMAALIAVNIAGSFIHYWYLFVILGQILFAIIFYFGKIKETAVVLLLSLVPLFIVWGHVFAAQATNGSMNFIRMRGDEIQRTLEDFLAPNYDVFMKLFIICIIAGLLQKLIESRSTIILKNEYLSGMVSFFKDKTNLFLLTLFVTLLIVPLIFSKLFVPVYIPGRYTITTFIPFVIVFAGFFYRFSEKRLIWLSLFVYFVIFIAPGFFFNTQEGPYSDRLKTKRVLEDLKDGDMLFYLPLSWITADYYLMRLKNTKHIIKTGFPDENYVKHPCWSNTYKLSSDEQAELKAKCAELKEFLKKSRARILVYWGRAPAINAEVLAEFKKNFREEYTIKQNNDIAVTYFVSK
jgi:hypothetical protein